MAVCSLWHCPWGRPRRALPGTVFPWSPDFPRHLAKKGRRRGRPAVWHGAEVGSANPAVKAKQRQAFFSEQERRMLTWVEM